MCASVFVPQGPAEFVPQGLEDSARGFNPGNTSTQQPALKGRKIFVIDGSFWSTPTHLMRRSWRPFRAGAFYIGTPG